MIRKSLKRKILFTLAFLFDVYKELSPRSFYQKLYSPLYRESTLLETLSRMAKVGEIEKKIDRGQVVLRISTRGESILNEDINLQRLAKKSWDGLWRIVIFDIEEKARYVRDMLRKKIKKFGICYVAGIRIHNSSPCCRGDERIFFKKKIFFLSAYVLKQSFLSRLIIRNLLHFSSISKNLPNHIHYWRSRQKIQSTP